MDIHNHIKNHIESEYGVTFDRNSECYYEKESNISFEIDEFEWDEIKHCKDFLILNDTVKIRLMQGVYILRTGKIDCYFSWTYLNNDTFHSDITKDGKKKYGVISPDGKFYECCYSGHNNLQEDLTDRKLINYDSQHKSFEHYGWVKLTGAWMITCEFEFSHATTKWDYDKKIDIILTTNILTSEQVELMKAYIESLGRDKFMFMYRWYNLSDIEKLLQMTHLNMYDDVFTDLQIELSSELEKIELCKERKIEKTNNTLTTNDDEDDIE